MKFFGCGTVLTSIPSALPSTRAVVALIPARTVRSTAALWNTSARAPQRTAFFAGLRRRGRAGSAAPLRWSFRPRRPAARYAAPCRNGFGENAYRCSACASANRGSVLPVPGSAQAIAAAVAWQRSWRCWASSSGSRASLTLSLRSFLPVGPTRSLTPAVNVPFLSASTFGLYCTCGAA